MNRSTIYKTLKAPLHNTRWSWGSTRNDGTVILTVWDDEIKKIDGEWAACVFRADNLTPNFWNLEGRPGLNERKEHLEKIREGAPCYMVKVTAESTVAEVRKIIHIDDDLLVGNELVTDDRGDTYLTYTGRVHRSQLV
jgi:hypothetical protein